MSSGGVFLTLCACSHVCLCPGDGGVETAEEAVEPAEPDINELCTDMFEKMAIFLQGELTGLSILSILQYIHSHLGTSSGLFAF